MKEHSGIWWVGRFFLILIFITVTELYALSILTKLYTIRGLNILYENYVLIKYYL